MFTEITIRNFKCFEEIVLSDLKRINLFTGTQIRT